MKKIKFVFKSLIDLAIFIFYKIKYTLKKNYLTEVWLISERGIDARDNGYFFYKYMKDNHPEIPVKYVISKDSSDLKKIKEEDIVTYRSKEHYNFFFSSKVLISAQIMGFSPNEQLYYRLNKYGLLKCKNKTIFLQHGITKDFNPYMLKQFTKLDLFVCGAIPERKYMIEKYGYSDKEAVLTGFARFDNLIDLNEKIILIMPTWRKWLKYNNNLINTQFYDEYMKLLNDKDIISLIEKKKYKIIFYPHIIFQKFLNNFSTKSKNVILASFNDYDVQDLLKRSKLLITDYSSVAFDFAYMKKKVVYYQFDEERYRGEQYSTGYYDYRKDGFGPVVSEFVEIKKHIINFLNDENYLNNYNEKISLFFRESDNKNCDRIYEKILDLLKEDK